MTRNRSLSDRRPFPERIERLLERLDTILPAVENCKDQTGRINELVAQRDAQAGLLELPGADKLPAKERTEHQQRVEALSNDLETLFQPRQQAAAQVRQFLDDLRAAGRLARGQAEQLFVKMERLWLWRSADSFPGISRQMGPTYQDLLTIRKLLGEVLDCYSPGQRLREVRRRAHHTQAQAASEIGIGERLQVHHLDGHESNADPRNPLVVCRSCNQRADRVLKAHGQGRRTRQYNPAETGAASLGEYVSALRILKGETAGDFDTARQTIHNTPPDGRSEFAREIWRRRRRSAAGGRDVDLVRRLTGG